MHNYSNPEAMNGFTSDDIRWLVKNGIDYRDYELVRRLRETRDTH